MPIIHLDEGDCLSAYINASDAGLLNEFNDPNYCYDTKSEIIRTHTHTHTVNSYSFVLSVVFLIIFPLLMLRTYFHSEFIILTFPFSDKLS